MGHYWRDMYPKEAAEQDRRHAKLAKLDASERVGDLIEALDMTDFESRIFKARLIKILKKLAK